MKPQQPREAAAPATNMERSPCDADQPEDLVVAYTRRLLARKPAGDHTGPCTSADRCVLYQGCPLW
jgi:hypothetical protein